MTEHEEWIWLAGLLEGEGWFCAELLPSGTRSLRVGVAMTDKDVVERAARLMDVVVNRRVHENQPTWKPQWDARACGLGAENVMRTVLPYMGVRRTARITECLAYPDLSHYAKIERLFRTEKACTKCDSTKPLTEFYKRPGATDGRHSECKQCRADAKQARLAA